MDAVPTAVPQETRSETTARLFAERAAERPDGLAQRAVGYDDIAPDTIEDLSPMHRLMTTLDKKDEEVEIAGDEG